MPEYHVGCGAFGIYAGTLSPVRKDGSQLWKQKSDVTKECVGAVVQYYKQELDCKEKTKFHTEFQFRDGTVVSLDISKVVGGAVDHPDHYNQPGQKECIDEMAEKFGTEAVKQFCLLNWFKYLYRHTMKNGQEDLDKAEWYKDKFLALGGSPDQLILPDNYRKDDQDDKD